MQTLMNSEATKARALDGIPVSGAWKADSKGFYPNMKSKPGVKSGGKTPVKNADMKHMAACIRAIADPRTVRRSRTCLGSMRRG